MANLGDVISPGGTPSTIVIPSGTTGDSGITSALLLSSLLGNRGFGGYSGDAGRGGLDSAATAAIIAAITANETNSNVGDIKAAVPLAEGQVQLALAGAVQALTAQSNDNTSTLAQGHTNILLSNLTNQAALARDIAGVNVASSVNTANILEAVREEGTATRSLITTNQIAELNRLAAERQDEIIELRNNNVRDRDRHGTEITLIQNQNQNQLQFQQQAQALNLLSSGVVDALQSIRATNQAINIGGTQTANPFNSNTNVKG